MRRPSRWRSIPRFLVALLIALVAIGRSGGGAIACESILTAASPEATRTDDHASMPQHGPQERPEHDGCDGPERESDCLLMPACAPAVSAGVTDASDWPTTARAVALPSPRAPAPVDRAPEPPPPRA